MNVIAPIDELNNKNTGQNQHQNKNLVLNP